MSNKNTNVEYKNDIKETSEKESIYLPHNLKLFLVEDLEIAFNIIFRNVKEDNIKNIKHFIRNKFGANCMFNKLENDGFLYIYIYSTEQSKNSIINIIQEEMKKDKRLVLKP